MHLDLIAGLPYEDYQRFGQSFNQVFELQADVIQLGFLKLLKGSPIYQEKDRYGYKFQRLAPYQVLANNYMDYCEEVGCDIWGILTSIKSPLGEPVCLWLPKKYVKEGTSIYVQGVEVPLDYQGEIPEGFDVITLPKSTYLKFIGEPFLEENYGEAIKTLWEAIDKFNPQSLGYRWDDKNPRIQLEPIGKRGYIELVPVKI